MGAGAADIAEIVSDVKERLPDLKPPPQLEPEQARFRLFDSITAFLKGAGRRQPLVLVLEDLHWADRPSLLLLEFLAREFSNARLLVIGTYRDVEVSRGHPLSQSLGELTRERLFQRVLLRGLSQEDVGRFIELVAGVTPPRGMVEAVYRQTEGNPLFVTEVVRLLVQEGAVGTGFRPAPTTDTGRDTWSVRIPEGVREVIGRRLDRLSERCNQTLTIASVIGREFSLGQLHRLIDDPSAGSGQRMSEDRLLEVLEEALAAKVIEELPRSVGRYQFTHALMQETLVEELTTTRRVRLHARIAQALEELYGDDAPAQAAELAHHFAEAQTVLGTEKLVRYSLLAGERALTSYAYEEAMAHFRRGLAAKGVPLTASEPAKDSEAAALLAGLGRSQVATLQVYQLQEAVSLLSRAFEYYAAIGDVDRAVVIASTPTPVAAGYRTGMAQLINRALALVPGDSLEEGRLLSLHGRLVGTEEGDYEGAQRALDQAQAIAQRQGDVALELRALADAAETLGYRSRYQEALEKALRAAELARRVDDPRSEMLGHYWAALLLVSMGDPVRAEGHAVASVAAAERLRHHFYLARALWAQECLAGCRGQWQAARELNDRGLGVSPRESRLLCTRVILECEVGNFKDSEAYQERLLEVTRLTPRGPTVDRAFTAIAIPVAGRITGLSERLDMAQEAAETVLSYPSANPLLADIARAGLGLLAVLRGDALAAEQYHTALAHAEGMAIMTVVGIQPDWLLALLAHTMGDLDKAAEHFEDALAFCRKAGYRPQLAWTCCDYADCLLQRAGPVGAGFKPAPTPGDRQKAMALLDEALRISRELGMRPLMERVLARRQILAA
jgi:predicted ATPase